MTDPVTQAVTGTITWTTAPDAATGTPPQNAVPEPRPAEPGGGLNAVEDPECIPDRKMYRSFYVEDEAFHRFRAAIYWLSRDPRAAGEVSESMTADIERYMRDVATALEVSFNGGEVFPMPPATKRRKKRKD